MITVSQKSYRALVTNLKVLQVLECLGTIFGMIACVLLNFYSKHPNMLLVLSLYTGSAGLLSMCSYAKNMSWMAVLMMFYFIVGSYGIYNLF